MSSSDEPSFTVGLPTLEPTVSDKDGNDYGKVRLPILMRVADYAEELRKNKNAKLRDCLLVPFRNIERNSDGELTRLLEDKLRRGEALLLLDGLDEVTEPSDRVKIVSQIEEFVRNTHSDNRVIITSRIVGYRQAPLGNDYRHFTLLEMEREQIEKFLNDWCLAVERFLSPDASDEIIASRAKAEIDGILKSVDGNTGVKRLATNPLLLTILALIHRNGSRLPNRRVELYELAANTLLTDWQAAKGMDGSKLISKTDAAQFLWPLAHWMHSERPTGLAYEQEVEAKLCEFRSRDTGKSPDHSEVIAAVDYFLARASRSTGIFVLRAPKQYGFLHLTFQEYFAALQLVRNSMQAAQRIYEVRHKPRWEEPILLAIASRQSPDDGNLLVRAAILAEGDFAQQSGFNPSEYEDILHRDLFLAARCLADDVAVYPELRRQIVNRLCELYFDPKSPRSLAEDILQSFSLIGVSNAADDLIGILTVQLSDLDLDADVRYAAVRAFGALGEDLVTEKVLESLLQFLDDSGAEVQSAVAGEFGSLGGRVVIKKVLESLLKLFNNSTDRTLASLGEKAVREKVLESLLQLFNNSESDVRSAAARAFDTLGEEAASEKVLESLLQLLSDSDAEVRSAATRALGSYGERAASEEVLKALLQLFKDSEADVRSVAARALGSLGEKASSEKALEALLQLFNDSDPDVRSAAAYTFGSLGEKASSEKALEALLQLFDVSDAAVKSAAAIALGAMGESAAIGHVISSLIKLLADSEGAVRSAGAIALGELGEKAASDQVISSLIKLLVDSDEDVRYAAAIALGAMGERAASDQVISSLIELLADSDEDVRYAAAMALGAMGEKAASDQVISSLIKLLVASDEDVRDAAVSALDNLSELANEDAKPEVIKLALPLARNKRRGEKNDSKREAGYVMLRNLMATDVSGDEM